MEKIESIRRGRIWLNVYKNDDGELAITIQKSFPAKDGSWIKTPFLVPRYNDLINLVEALAEFTAMDHWQEEERRWAQ